MSTRGAHFLSEALERGRARGMGMAKGQRGGRTADSGTREGPGDGRYGRSPGDGRHGRNPGGGQYGRNPGGGRSARSPSGGTPSLPSAGRPILLPRRCIAAETDSGIDFSAVSRETMQEPRKQHIHAQSEAGKQLYTLFQPAPCRKKGRAMEIAAPAGFSARPVRVFVSCEE